MHKKKIIVLALGGIAFSGIIFSFPVYAKKALPVATKTSKTSRSSGVTTLVKKRPDKLGIIVSFSKMSNASSISYFFSYSTRGTSQGINGTISPDSSETTREMIFGTCSNGICRYDYGISNAKLVVATTLKNGLKVMKTFKIKA